jgi:hypothetical protein
VLERADRAAFASAQVVEFQKGNFPSVPNRTSLPRDRRLDLFARRRGSRIKKIPMDWKPDSSLTVLAQSRSGRHLARFRSAMSAAGDA